MVSIDWYVSAPSTVKAGDTVKVTANVKFSGYSGSLTVNLTVKLFGQTKSRNAILPEPGIYFPIELTFTAPDREDRYTGVATLSAYY